MKQQDDYDVVVLILTDDCADRIDRTVQSVFDQTFDGSRVKIVAVDNHSSDGTYEKLMRYVKEDRISMYRLEEKYTPTRLLRAAIVFLEYVEYKYLLVLNAGDELYPDCIGKCAAIMDEHTHTDRGILIFETDIKDESGNISHQTPIFSENCILLKTEHYAQFFTSGAGHRIQCFYCHGVLMANFSEFPYIVDYNDWSKKALFIFRTGCIYIKDAFACTLAPKCDDELSDLILRLFLVKKLELTRNIVYSDRSYEYLDEPGSKKKIYETLSTMALKYAADALGRGDAGYANKILLFAEMVDEDVTHSEFYLMLKNSVAHGRLIEPVERYRGRDESMYPPDGAVMIS